ncbi:phosphopantetheine-binding protein [Micromonospora sp. DT227]|uniref:phosphopantetheine-binding protein n=1 Tax=Micromonospora sp. DT227 TaxID=3393433 RepID=UPI003CE970AA
MPIDHCTPTEAAVLRLWTDLLPPSAGAPPIRSLDDDFFDLGGNSLGMIRFLFEVQERYQVELPVADLYSDASTITVAAAARAIDDALATAAGRAGTPEVTE